MIIPSPRLVALLAIPAIATFTLTFYPPATQFILVLDGIVLGIALMDLLFLPKKTWFEATRTGSRIHSLEHTHEHQLWLDVRSPYPIALEIWAEFPESMAVEGLPHRLTSPSARLEIPYTLCPYQRGRYTSQWVKVLAQSRFGFWNRSFKLEALKEIHVYPNIKRMEDLALLARTNHEHLLGVRKVRKLGGDQEFESLREYVKGDEFRIIDWKSSAKRRLLMARNYRPEENQTLIFMLDCGRMMTGQFDGLTLLDRALNAMLLLSYVALKAGDRVGLIAFSSDVQASVVAKSGAFHLQQMIHASFDLFPQYHESNFDKAFEHLSTHFRKRSLVILFTQILDEVNAKQVQRHLSVLAGRHLPLCVQIQDPALNQIIKEPPIDRKDLYEMAAAAHILDWQRNVLANLKKQGALVLESLPDQISSGLINRYLEIKARHLL